MSLQFMSLGGCCADMPILGDLRVRGPVDNYKSLNGLKDALGRKWKLTLVAEALGFSSVGAHDALADVMMLKNIFFMVDPIIHPDR